MRQIKFRAWDKKENKFLDITPMPQGFLVNDFILDAVEGEQRILSGKNGKNIFITMDGKVVSLCPVTDLSTCANDDSWRYELMQFTGLHDKTGKEIWEGDIVLCHKCDGNVLEIQWLEYHSGWNLNSEESKGCEVLGNISSNPELLK